MTTGNEVHTRSSPRMSHSKVSLLSSDCCHRPMTCSCSNQHGENKTSTSPSGTSSYITDTSAPNRGQVMSRYAADVPEWGAPTVRGGRLTAMVGFYISGRAGIWGPGVMRMGWRGRVRLVRTHGWEGRCSWIRNEGRMEVGGAFTVWPACLYLCVISLLSKYPRSEWVD